AVPPRRDRAGRGLVENVGHEEGLREPRYGAAESLASGCRGVRALAAGFEAADHAEDEAGDQRELDPAASVVPAEIFAAPAGERDEHGNCDTANHAILPTVGDHSPQAAKNARLAVNKG